jgi:very-short-patch-repair endonuclease
MGKIKPTDITRTLRRNQTDAERKLWARLRELRVIGLRFRRQHAIGKYIVDFVCLEKKLVLEIDGGQHNETPSIQKDAERTRWLESEGYHILRFWNNDVLMNTNGVLDEISEALKLNTPSS